MTLGGGDLGDLGPFPADPDPISAPRSAPAPADGWTPSPSELSRRAYRQQRTRRSVVIATVSTVVLLTVVVLVVINTPGWPQFRKKFFDVSYGWEVLPEIAKGLWLNIRLAVVCEIGILV